MTHRRSFLAGVLATGLYPAASWAEVGDPAFLAAAKIDSEQYVLCGLSKDGDVVFSLTLPGRGHAAAAHPNLPQAVVIARRPGTFAIVLDCRTGHRISLLNLSDGRHFCGHGVYSKDGEMLFTTENNFATGRGEIGIWDVKRNYRRVGQISSGGIGPHDISLMPKGQLLVVANGGVETHPDSGRAQLNLATMKSNISFISLQGGIMDKIELGPTFQRNSIRHLAVSSNGTIAFAMQWKGNLDVNPPLLGIRRDGEAVQLINAPFAEHLLMLGYAGSIAICSDERMVAISSPRGGLLQIFDLMSGHYFGSYNSTDLCGVGRSSSGFTITTGTGQIAKLEGKTEVWSRQSDCLWDNHLIHVRQEITD